MSEDIQLYLGDCFEHLLKVKDESVDLILIDPPYGTIKDMNKSDFIYKERNLEWDIKLDIDKMFFEITRILKKSGRAIIFCQEPFTQELMNAQKQLKFNMRALWLKNKTGNALNSKKTLVNMYEDILIFTKNTGTTNNLKLREYSKLFFENTKDKDLKDIVGYRYKAFKSINNIQFRLCTKDVYESISDFYNLREKEFFIDFETLKTFNEDVIPTFNLKERQKSNVFKYPKDHKPFHPTQKPVPLLKDLIETFSNTGDLIVDFVMGSGSTGVACKETGRNFIGIELDHKYYSIARSRIIE